MSTFAERLNQFIKHQSLTPSSFAKKCGFKWVSKVDQYLKGENKPKIEALNMIQTAFPLLNMDWLTLGEGEMLSKQKSNTLREDQQEYTTTHTKDHTVPLFSNSDKNKMAVMTMETLSRIKTKEELDDFFKQEKLPNGIAIIPDLNHCHAYLEMNSDEMEPTIKSGEKMACRRKDSIDYIIPGNYYLLNIEGDILVRRLYHSEEENTFLLKADNDFYPAHTVKKSMVRYMFTIHGQLDIKRQSAPPKIAA